MYFTCPKCGEKLGLIAVPIEPELSPKQILWKALKANKHIEIETEGAIPITLRFNPPLQQLETKEGDQWHKTDLTAKDVLKEKWRILE